MNSLGYLKEDLLHYIWKSKSFDLSDLSTDKGETLVIQNFGFHNGNSGPDFIDAKIEIEGTKWAGNIELHIHSSDWDLHNHSSDPAYNNVILHVVFNHDKDIILKNGRLLPTLELKSRIDHSLLHKYQRLMENQNWVACESLVSPEDWSDFNLWKYRLVSNRLERKTQYFRNLLVATNNNWDEVCYKGFLRYMGSQTNAAPFEQLSQNLSYSILLKNVNSILKLEALLFGVAGFLDEEGDDEYFKTLQVEWLHLKAKYSLNNMDAHVWKFYKMRPVGFPTIRIAQIAALMYKNPRPFTQFIDRKWSDSMYESLEATPSEYWKTHYRFGVESKASSKKISKTMVQNLMVNVVVPLTFLYGKETGVEEISQRGIELLDELPAEKNTIINHWKELGVEAKSACDSQALIELKNENCTLLKCMNCPIGIKNLKK